MTRRKPAGREQQVGVAVDNVIFTVLEERLQVLLVQVRKAGLEGRWALPGGMIGDDEALDAAAARVLEEQTGMKDVFLEQLYTFGQPDRDPFCRVVSCAYYSLLPRRAGGERALRATEKYDGVAWAPAASARRLAYDHDEILSYARKRLAWKLEYTNVVFSLLPESFTLTELQRTYEVVLDRELDKRNFRKKVLAVGLVKATGEKTSGGAHRPAKLFRVTERAPFFVEVL